MKPVVAIIGRTNVGKSTLFNRIVGKNKAVIDDLPELTRDRNYAEVQWEGKDFILIDTGGFEPSSPGDLTARIREQTQLAIEEADSIIFLADGRTGLTPTDTEIVRMLKPTKKPIFHTINKIDGPQQREQMVEFHQLGVDTLIPISAKHKIGIFELMSEVTSHFPDADRKADDESYIKIAIVGRPNVGKSSLINTMIGRKRFLTDESPGTTRDAIDTTFTFLHQKFLLIDTAGIRRKSRVSINFEKFCIIEALRSLDRCDIALLVIDVTEGVTQQDAKIGRFIYEKGKGCIIVVNKWDLIEKDTSTHKRSLERVRLELKFLDFAPVIFLSALTGQSVSHILKIAPRIYSYHRKRIPTPQLNKVIQQAVQHHPPPFYRHRTLKFYYATQIAESPPHVVIFTNYPSAVDTSYQRYLINQIQDTFGFEGTPVRLSFRQKEKKT